LDVTVDENRVLEPSAFIPSGGNTGWSYRDIAGNLCLTGHNERIGGAKQADSKIEVG
jgi:hypothetical protein